MTFGLYESSYNSGHPINLYYFRFGSVPNAFYAYTDSDTPVVHEGVTYKPIPIQRGVVTASGALDKAAMEIRTPHDSEISDLFRVYPPGQVVTLKVSQGHLTDGDAEFLVLWTGRVVSVSRQDYEAVISCEPVQTSLRRSGLRRNYQYGCPHVLYGPKCRASKAAATFPFEVSSVGSTFIVMQDAWYAPSEVYRFITGMVEWDTDRGVEVRTILACDPDAKTLSLSGDTRAMMAGDTIRLIWGCGHMMDHCKHLHNNIQNYGGQPWIPTKNPIRTNPFW